MSIRSPAFSSVSGRCSILLRILVFSMILLFVLLAATRLESRTWTIKADGTGDAPTIQAGVDSAAVGDTVLVGPGVYSDATEVLVDGELKLVVVHLYKNVKLFAEGNGGTTTIDGSKASLGILVENADATTEIEGFSINTTFEAYGCVDAVQSPGSTFGWSERQPDFDVGIWCESSSLVIRNNHLSDNGTAILLRSSPAMVTGNEIHKSFFGVVAEQMSDATIESNKVYDCAALVHVAGSSPLVCDNELFSQYADVCDAIVLSNSSADISSNRIQAAYVNGINMGSSDPKIEGNWLLDNWRGVMVNGGSPIIRQNLFVDNGTAIEFDGSVGSEFTNNTIFGFVTGIFCQDGSRPLIRGNILNNGSDGIFCLLFAAPVIECNDVFDVTRAYGGDCSDQTGVNGNFSLDPEFCGIDSSGNYFLQSDSPCAPGNHPSGYDCGLIGALPVNCGKVETAKSTWGAIKGKFKATADGK